MSPCVLLTAIEKGGTDSAAREVGMNKKRANLCGLGMGVQLGRVAACARIAPEERSTSAPAAATDQLRAVLDHKVGFIANQLCVDTKCAAQCPLDLGWTVVAGTEGSRRQRDEPFNLTQITEYGVAKVKTLRKQGVPKVRSHSSIQPQVPRVRQHKRVSS